MGTDKRERQRQGRQAKSVAEEAAARRQKTKRTGVRLGIGLAIVLALAFGYSLLTRDDGSSDNTETADTTTTAAGDQTTTTAAYSNPDLAAEVLARKPPIPTNADADTPPDAVKVETLIEGQGEGAAAGDTVTVHYVGVLADGTEFDQSWSRGQPFAVENLGQASVIAGWNEGLVGAKIGERRRLEIGSDKAYGATGNPPTIPANAPLAFEIDVVDITKPTG
ncbi:MAG: FKBP-type peptidyl-prolyl cis-trans isomerase [Acidimicrobiales bacterium]